MAAQYEKRVLTMDAWVQKQGYPPFCEVVTQEDGLANLQLIVDKVRGKEVPRVPAVSAFIEFCVGMMTGEVEKGGCRELRADPQLYATAGYGLSQAEMMMPLEKKGTFGWGPYKDAPYKLQSIQQYATALRVWLKEELRRWPDAGVANPMYDGWVASVMNYVQKELPFARMEERLPPALTTGVFNEVISHIDPTSQDEMSTALYLQAGSIHGDRAHDWYLSDRENLRRLAPTVEDPDQKHGVMISHESTKNNKLREERHKGLACPSWCEQEVAFTAAGQLDVTKMCASCMTKHMQDMVDQSLSGATEETLESLPMFVEIKEIVDLPAGSNLVR